MPYQYKAWEGRLDPPWWLGEVSWGGALARPRISVGQVEIAAGTIVTG